MRIPTLGLACLLALLPAISTAHSGRTDASGCHNDRKNGGRHCHGGASPRPSSTLAPAFRLRATSPRRPAAEHVHSDPEPPHDDLHGHETSTIDRPGRERAPGIGPVRSPRLVKPQVQDSDSGRPLYYFANCQQAFVAGRAPILTVRDGYRPGLDPNQNKIACETGE